MKGLLLKDWYQIKSNMKTMYLTVLAVLVIWTLSASGASTVSYTHLRAHETDSYLVCRLLLEKKKNKHKKKKK